ncbi:MAG: TolC family protein [Bacteroidia bacterium]|nr:TolC family protein [Bacteroidia bacterium]
MLRIRFLYLTFFMLLSFRLFSQESFKDTLKISLQQADSIFIANNLSLLAEKCNVNAAKAQIIQAKLFTNPTVSINQNVYNAEYKTNGGKEWFGMTDKGETSAQLQKLFRLAGKRNKQIQISSLTADREEQNYFDLLRTLKYSLRSGFYNIYILDQILKLYDKEIYSLNKLIDVFQTQYEKGYISKKELLRLKSALFSLENEKLGYSTQLIGNLGDFNVLMHTSNINYVPLVNEASLGKDSLDSLKLQVLIDTALVYRQDLKMARSDLKINEYNLAYQKAVAIPDLTLSGGWDRNGSFIHNYNFIGVQIDLPFFNRNQGNIKSAAFNLDGSKYKLQSMEDQMRTDVIGAFATARQNNQLFHKFDQNFMKDLDELNREMLKNYEKKNISLIEFLDYYDAYKENCVQFNNLLYNRINSFENINYSVGKDVIYTK